MEKMILVKRSEQNGDAFGSDRFQFFDNMFTAMRYVFNEPSMDYVKLTNVSPDHVSFEGKTGYGSVVMWELLEEDILDYSDVMDEP